MAGTFPISKQCEGTQEFPRDVEIRKTSENKLCQRKYQAEQKY